MKMRRFRFNHSTKQNDHKEVGWHVQVKSTLCSGDGGHKNSDAQIRESDSIYPTMEKEFQALQANGIWTLIPRQPNDNVINTKWVFIVKTKEDGSIERFKVQLVANGMRQVHGSDYLNTFSLVVKPMSIRLVLTLAVT